MATPISASSSATCFSTNRLKYSSETGKELEGSVGDDHGIVVPGGDARHRLLAIAGLEVVLPGHEEPGLRVQLQKLRSPLVHQMIRHHEHRLLRQLQAAEFHRGGGHGPGLARSHDVGQQWAAALENSPDGILLMRREVSIAKGGADHSGQGQVRTVELPETDVVEPEVVLLCQPPGALAIFPNPFTKAILQLLLLLARGNRFRWLTVRLPSWCSS